MGGHARVARTPDFSASKFLGLGWLQYGEPWSISGVRAEVARGGGDGGIRQSVVDRWIAEIRGG